MIQPERIFLLAPVIIESLRNRAMFLKDKPRQRLLSIGEVEETIDPPVLQSSQIAGDMNVMWSQPGEVFRVGNHRKFAANSNQPLGGSIDTPLPLPSSSMRLFCFQSKTGRCIQRLS